MYHGEELISMKEAARRVGVSNVAVLYWIRSNLLPAFKVGNTYAILVSDLEKANERSLGTPNRKHAMRSRQQSNTTQA